MKCTGPMYTFSLCKTHDVHKTFLFLHRFNSNLHQWIRFWRYTFSDDLVKFYLLFKPQPSFKVRISIKTCIIGVSKSIWHFSPLITSKIFIRNPQKLGILYSRNEHFIWYKCGCVTFIDQAIMLKIKLSSFLPLERLAEWQLEYLFMISTEKMTLGVNRNYPVGRKFQNHNNPLLCGEYHENTKQYDRTQAFWASLHNVSKNMEVLSFCHNRSNGKK